MLTMLIAGGVFSAAAVTRWYLHRTSRRETLWAKGQVELTEAWNEKAAFSLALPKPVVTVFSALALLFAWTARKKAPLSAGLLLGGGGANLYERLRHKKVYDYVRFPKTPGRMKCFIWNLADFAILLGAFGLVFRDKKK